MKTPGFVAARRGATLLAVALATIACHHHALALNPQTRLADYNHATWSDKDGAPAEVAYMAQTVDGWLWLSGPSGLYRFDGIRFERYPLGKDSVSQRRPWMLHAHPKGGLLFSYFLLGGITWLHPDGSMEVLAAPDTISSPGSLAVDDDGSIWAAGPKDIRRRDANGKWRSFDIPGPYMQDVKIDRHGQVWATDAQGLYLFDRKTETFNRVRDLPARSSLTEAPDGRMWVSNSIGVQALPVPSTPPTRAVRKGAAESGWNPQFDRNGNLWMLKCGTGICVQSNAAASGKAELTPARDATDRFDQPWHMSSLVANAMLEDRSGNIWIATQLGLERFRDNKLVPAHVPGSGYLSLAMDTDRQLWAADQMLGTAWRVSANAAPVADRTQWYSHVLNDRNGALLLVSHYEIERRANGKIEKVPLPTRPGPNGEPLPGNVRGVQDDGKVIWTATMQTGLTGYVDGAWQPRSKFNLPPKITLTHYGEPGHFWMASGESAIVHYTNDKQTTYDGSMIGGATMIYATSGIMIAGDRGIAVLKDKAFRKLDAAEPDVLTNVSGVAITSNGDRWLNGAKGVVHIRKADWQASLIRPELPLRYELIGSSDGYRGHAMLTSRIHSALADADDNVWLVSTGGLLRLDTRSIQSNDTPPVVQIQKISTADKSYDAVAGLRLPAGSQDINFQFTAPSLSRPELLRFQYRLDGYDSDWQDAGTRRVAYYTNIGPGSYRFQVRAKNEDGVWSTAAATASFEVEAMFYQTVWFKIACALALAAALYMLYLYRLRIATARLEERMEVRSAERERIARALHDTVLQGVQGMVLRLDSATGKLPQDDAMYKQLAPILQHARTAIDEGRAQLHDLRSAHVDDVESMVSGVATLMGASYPGAAFSFKVDGVRQALQPHAADEICEITREAMRNAFQHAEATRIEVRLAYDQDQFTVLVRDDGQGIVGQPADASPEQTHWGLTGMRERAAKAGATLSIDTSPENGTSVTLKVPASRAYVGRPRRWWHPARGS